MKDIFRDIILSLMLAGLAACSFSGDSEDRNVIYKDIIQGFRELTDSQEETRIQSDFLWTDTSLGTGWSISERTHRWAVGLESTLTFNAEADTHYTLHLQCHPPGFTKEPQELSLFLNEKFVEKIRLSLREKNYSFDLPEASLVSGGNELSFRYAHTQNPCDFTEKNDCRELALAFEKIEFEFRPQEPAASVKLENGVIAQTAGTSFSYYAKLPEQASLKMLLKHKAKGLEALVTIQTDDAADKEFRLTRQGEHSIDLADFAGEIIKISFQADSPQSGSDAAKATIKWSSIQLQTPAKDESAERDTTNSQALRKVLTQYNVIYLVLDAFHAKHASVYGYERQTTPFLDELAEESVVFDKMFVNAPYTLASTASLFTSRYSHEHGLVEEINRIHPIIPTLSEWLAGEGIESGLISDSGWLKESAWGLLRGFSQRYNKQRYSHDAQEVISALNDFYSSHTEQRSFTYIHLIPPHGPYTPPEEFRIFMEPVPNSITPTSQNLAAIDKGELAMTQRQLDYIIAQYDANILFADHLTRQIFNFLEEQEILEKSIVIVSSDHGEAFRQHGRMLHNTTVFDEMLHVPFLMRFPKALELPAGRIAHPVSLIDVAPTLADIYGISELSEFSGTSLIPLILGEEDSWQHFVYAESLYTGARTLRDAQYKYIHSPA
ncbi:MAG: sulfatase, partial [bacterium]|nr:sulfatase [bacterium]